MGCASSSSSSRASSGKHMSIKDQFIGLTKSAFKVNSNRDSNQEEIKIPFLIQTLLDHEGGINCMDISEDKSLLVTGGEDKTIRLWAALSTPVECIATLKGHQSYVTCCVITGCHLVSGSADKTLRLWSAEEEACLAVFIGHTSIINHIMVENGFIFSVSYDRTCRVWDLEHDCVFSRKKNKIRKEPMPSLKIEDEELNVIESKEVENLDINHDENYDMMSLNEQERIQVEHDRHEGPKCDIGCCIRIFEGHEKSVTQLVYIPYERDIIDARIHENDLIATASTDCTIRVWEMKSGECRRVLEGHQGPVNCVTVDPNNMRHIYSGGADRVIKCWDVVTGDLIRELKGHEGAILVLNINKKILYTGSSDRTARSWVMEFGECTRTFWRNQGAVTCLNCFQGMLFTGSCDSSARIYDSKSGILKRTCIGHENAITGLATAPGRMYTCAYDGHLCVWDCRGIREDTVFGNVSLTSIKSAIQSEEDDVDLCDSQNVKDAISALEPFIRNFK